METIKSNSNHDVKHEETCSTTDRTTKEYIFCFGLDVDINSASTHLRTTLIYVFFINISTFLIGINGIEVRDHFEPYAEDFIARYYYLFDLNIHILG